jgi:hypothetical protein
MQESVPLSKSTSNDVTWLGTIFTRSSAERWMLACVRLGELTTFTALMHFLSDTIDFSISQLRCPYLSCAARACLRDIAGELKTKGHAARKRTPLETLVVQRMLTVSWLELECGIFSYIRPVVFSGFGLNCSYGGQRDQGGREEGRLEMSKIGALVGLLAIGFMFMSSALAHYRSHSYYGWHRPYPAACESVWFPRSPLCGSRGPSPWDWYCFGWRC